MKPSLNFDSFFGGVLLLLFCCLEICTGDWRQHHRYTDAAAAARRVKRQFGGGTPQTQIDLNITVPFIFSARLYPYGSLRSDSVLGDRQDSQTLRLKQPLTYFGKKYSTIHILRDGAIGFSSGLERQDRSIKFPRGDAAIAVYWAPASIGRTGKVYFRETQDPNILNLAKNEVQIQYRQGEDFKATSVVIITWENLAPKTAEPNLSNNQRNLFQISIIISNNGSFAHLVYSKLNWNDNAVAGFNQGEDEGAGGYWLMPGSGTDQTRLLANTSDIGIPGEWLFKIDEPQIFLCGTGYKGIECIDKCSSGEWYYDCARRCHCADRGECNPVDGRCTSGRCRQGWLNAPVCDLDDDECETQGARALCPAASPDCVNTPGAYLCMCLAGYDNVTHACRGARPETEDRQRVQVVPITPRVVTPRLILPTFVDNGVTPRPRITAVQNVGFNAPIRTDDGAAFRPRTIVPQTVAPRRPIEVRTTPAPTAPPSTRRPRPTSTRFTFPQFLFSTQRPQTPRRRPDVRPQTPPPVAAANDPNCRLTCGKNAHCEVIVRDQPVCKCNQGWSGDGEFCVDVNECFLGNVCGANSHCQNTPGGHTCICEEGFYSDGENCVDVDECAEDFIVCPGGNSSVCLNKYGSYECKCKEGFNGNPSSHLGCIDINECLIPEFYCGTTADCENVHGSFICHCKKGYQRNVRGDKCEDIDECLRTPCDQAALCRNIIGSFSCSCIDGYGGNGFQCEETILYEYSRLEDDKLHTRRNSYLRKELAEPIKIFGEQRNVLFISSNGVVTLDEPLTEYGGELLEDMPMPTFSPLYIRTDLTQGGHVFVSESKDPDMLTRATLNVQQDFHNNQFQAKSVIIVTYEDVQVQGSDRDEKNTYQLVLTSGGASAATYATFIYDTVTAASGQAGVAHGYQSALAGAPLYLPGSGVNATRLRDASNVGTPGRWLMRVDAPLLAPCPAGRRAPPLCAAGCQAGTWGDNCAGWCRCADGIPCDFRTGHCSNRQCQAGYTGDNCQTDINECDELNKCSDMSTCTNTEGSYTCTCFDGYTGDGSSCKKLDACSRTYGVSCHERATCLQDTQGNHHCLCLDGFQGDGFDCLPFQAPVNPSTLAPTTTRATEAVTTAAPTRPPTTTTTTRSTPAAPILTFRPIHTPAPQTRPTTPRRVVTRPTPPKKPKHIADNIDTVYSSGVGNTRGGYNNQYDQTDTSNMLVIIIPAALCGVWLLLIVILLAVCLRRRKMKQAEKYGLGYYVPPSSTTAASAKNGTAAAATTPSASAAYYGSQWSIPRPNYDYYQGGTSYYPNPYGTNGAYNHKY